jgi:hypothetical protein
VKVCRPFFGEDHLVTSACSLVLPLAPALLYCSSEIESLSSMECICASVLLVKTTQRAPWRDLWSTGYMSGRSREGRLALLSLSADSWDSLLSLVEN